MTTLGNPLLLSPEGYQIERSVRLRSSASAYFNRTPASAGNRKTWTWSGWVKRGALPSSGYYSFLGADSGSGSSFYIAFDNSTQRVEFGQGATVYRKTTQVFRDPSAWYHLVIHSDTTQATASNRLKVYVNGVEVTSFATSNDPSFNGDWALNNNVAHSIGADIPNTGARNYFDGYLTEVNFIDGQALTPSSFGETDAVTGVWKPKKYTGTYGTNGFYLNFSDPSAATAAAIGKDSSGNGNNWTPNNISVTAGNTYDSMLDVPTPYADGGNGRGNYCTLNAVIPQNQYKYNGTGTTGVLKNGNLDVVGPSGNWSSFIGTIFVSSGKWYWEVTDIAEPTANYCLVGTHSITESATPYFANGNNFAPSDVLGFALDMDAGTFVWYKNNVLQATLATGLTGQYAPWCDVANSNELAFNFGQRPFAYTPPTGFKALNTQNLPEPTIVDGSQYFDATTYTGNGTTQSIVNSGGMQPDLVWVKVRSAAYDNRLFDSSRPLNAWLSSNLTSAEINSTLNDNFLSYNSNGFSVGPTSATNGLNQSGQTFVGWQWKANGAGVSNTDGSITSTVSAGVTQGFSVVTYTGTGANATVGHGLGVAPAMVIVKNRDVGTQSWAVYHKDLGNTKAVYLNATQAPDIWSALWNNTSPTSTVFSVGSGAQVTNGNTNKMVAYCFAEVPGFSKFGSYTGNGSSTDGPFVYLGFRPRYVMLKATDATYANDWCVIDTERGPYNADGVTLRPNLSNAEFDDSASPTNGVVIDILSNGFKVRGTSGRINGSGSTVIFACFAEHPFKNALAR